MNEIEDIDMLEGINLCAAGIEKCKVHRVSLISLYLMDFDFYRLHFDID